MGVAGSTDIFQERMSTLMDGLEYVRAYLDDLLVITKGSYEDHLRKVKTVLQRLQDAGLRINLPKSSFCNQHLEYLGYGLTPNGIRPLTKKSRSNPSITTPYNASAIAKFLGHG